MRAAVAVKLLHGVAQPFECGGIVESALYEADALGEVLPRGFLERGAATGFDCCFDEFDEMLVGPVAAGEAGQSEAWRQQAAVCQVVYGWQELLLSQITGHAENHQAAWAGDARKTQVARVAQRVGPGWCVAHASIVLARGHEPSDCPRYDADFTTGVSIAADWRA